MFRENFTKMLQKYPNCVEDKKIFVAYMKDLFPGEKLMTNVLTSLLELGIIEDINLSTELNAPFSYRYTKNLMDNYGYSEENAGNAVFLMCVCYGEAVLGKTCTLQPQAAAEVTRDDPKVGGLYQDLFSFRMNGSKAVITGCNDASIRTLVVPNKLQGKFMQSIDRQAFSGMANLEQAVVTEGFVDMGSAAFENCNKLRQVILPYGIRSIADRTFTGCILLTTINIPETVFSIGNYALSGTGIKSVMMPNSVAIIGRGVFRDCDKLQDIQLSTSMTEISEEMFWGCTNLKKVVFPPNIRKIGKNAFCGCTAMKEFMIPDHIEYIDADAFSDVSPEFVILCEMGSEAEKFAQKHRMKYQLI